MKLQDFHELINLDYNILVYELIKIEMRVDNVVDNAPKAESIGTVNFTDWFITVEMDDEPIVRDYEGDEVIHSIGMAAIVTVIAEDEVVSNKVLHHLFNEKLVEVIMQGVVLAMVKGSHVMEINGIDKIVDVSVPINLDPIISLDIMELVELHFVIDEVILEVRYHRRIDVKVLLIINFTIRHIVEQEN